MELKNLGAPKVDFDVNKEAVILGEIRSTIEDRAKPADWVDIMSVGPRAQKSLAESLNNLLDLTGNDLESAKKSLQEISFAKNKKPAAYVISSLYYPQQDYSAMMKDHKDSTLITAVRDGLIQGTQEEYLAKNPKIKLLSFWLDVYYGGISLSPNSSSLDGLLGDVYPKSDIELKTQMMIFVKESLYARKVSKRKHVIIGEIARKEMTEKVKEESSRQPLLKKCNEVIKILELDSLLEQTEGGKIKIENLVSILEKSPSLINYMSGEELKKALNKAERNKNLHEKLTSLIKHRDVYREEMLVK